MPSTLNTAVEIRKIIPNTKVRELHKVSEWKGILSLAMN